ncbi:MAG: hypothetical protein CSB24_06890 [Deltaproteobacteria bacterium]|nr:MAG: hypothetical protein CSB24_06890 [Deltaproteobacteria bacterium]
MYQLIYKYMKTNYIIAILLLFTVNSCARFNCTEFEDQLGIEENLIKFSYNMAEDLIETAFPPLIPRHPDKPILTTTFVNNNNLQETSDFGRTLQQHLSSRLVQIGYTVEEVKLRSNLLIQPKRGEFMLSRHLYNLKGNHKAQAVMVGTFSFTGRTMYISARLVNPINQIIISSHDYRLCMDDNVLKMFGLKRVKIKTLKDNNKDCTEKGDSKWIEEPARPLF